MKTMQCKICSQIMEKKIGLSFSCGKCGYQVYLFDVGLYEYITYGGLQLFFYSANKHAEIRRRSLEILKIVPMIELTPTLAKMWLDKLKTYSLLS